jgi:hypothetical protein
MQNKPKYKIGKIGNMDLIPNSVSCILPPVVLERSGNPALDGSSEFCPMNPLYKTPNIQYHNRRIRRCSSMVEHSFRKAGVEGSTPSIGCFYLDASELIQGEH